MKMIPPSLPWTAFLLISVESCGLYCQSPPRLAFEVASIHELTPPFRALKMLSISGTRVTLEGYNVDWLVSEAFGLKEYQVSAVAVPQSTRGAYYSIEARAPGPSTPSRAEVRVMLRSLLSERFHLTIHREMKETPVYALVADKNGPSLKPGTGDADCATLIGPVIPTDRNYRYRLTNCNLDTFVDILPTDRPILNKTGLNGRYDISIFVTPEFRMRDTSEPGDIRFLDAVRPLGLRLDALKALVDVVVVDHFDATPSPN